jgi:large subunit ribosomal protein L21
MYAIIEEGGRQHKVSSGQKIQVSRMDKEPGDEVVLDKVLAVVKEDGSVFGNPYVVNANVKAEVSGSGKGKKVLVFKMKPRKGHRKLRGHRQQYTTLNIKEIVIGG